MIEESAERNVPAQVPNGLAYALQWSQLPVEHLQAALKAIEPELKREHELRALATLFVLRKNDRTLNAGAARTAARALTAAQQQQAVPPPTVSGPVA
ncbi:hypothetical protein AB0469_36240 [Streptomyces sp. NPDC093801]|uniref:hypothetical protein n=1 Tax=Streptomyces sp. NPDC093801 TaxID=3155203 RepID=UPI0034502E58